MPLELYGHSGAQPEDVVERMVVKPAFKPPPAKVIAMKPIERPRTNKVPIPPLALRDRALFYVVTVSNLRPRTSGL